MEPTSQDNNFIDDEQMEESRPFHRDVGKCNNVIFEDENGDEIICGNPCNPNEQLCHDCRVFGHRMTGLL